MRRLLFTIGFTGKSAQEFFALLSQAGVEKLIDIRQNRSGQLSAFAKHPDLLFFLRQIANIDYAHEPLLAPPPELLKSYRRAKDWAAYEANFLSVMRERGVPEILDMTSWPSKVALLCSEPGPEKCHRRLVAELLAAHLRAQGESVEVEHLVTVPARIAKPRRKKVVAVP